jgi:hypothetical protein
MTLNLIVSISDIYFCTFTRPSNIDRWNGVDHSSIEVSEYNQLSLNQSQAQKLSINIAENDDNIRIEGTVHVAEHDPTKLFAHGVFRGVSRSHLPFAPSCQSLDHMKHEIKNKRVTSVEFSRARHVLAEKKIWRKLKQIFIILSIVKFNTFKL